MTSIAQRFLSTTAPYLPTTYQAQATRYDDMPFRRAGRSGLLLPSISLGLWQNFGDADPIAPSHAVLRRAPLNELSDSFLKPISELIATKWLSRPKQATTCGPVRTASGVRGNI